MGLVAPPVHFLLPWDLNLFLSALQKPPFVNIQEISLLKLSQNVACLVAVTYARRVSELAGICSRTLYLVVLR